MKKPLGWFRQQTFRLVGAKMRIYVFIGFRFVYTNEFNGWTVNDEQEKFCYQYKKQLLTEGWQVYLVQRERTESVFIVLQIALVDVTCKGNEYG